MPPRLRSWPFATSPGSCAGRSSARSTGAGTARCNIVDRHVPSLRIKLQDDYRNPRFIATVPGQGYRFIPTFSNTGWGGPTAGERGTNLVQRFASA